MSGDIGPGNVILAGAFKDKSMVGILWSWNDTVDAGRTRARIFNTTSRSERLTMGPFHPVVLVTAELLGAAAEVVGREGLPGRHC
jgi:hypothetical protein